ncbi:MULTISPECIES: hypothetical protein [Enterobacter cloacae complex]|uniref:Uncharacterized protein n=2 Tax=Enterobacter cloacae complex TaxID=354276 RepID=A0A7H8UBT1_ENTCL|nr:MULTISPECIES: hypothetical protein [Enterobacter cloacae complex]MCM7514398.1 hypothetical protein [Enterobacter hormaechei]MBE4854320.1 hypothetical protein [Enterobacter pasteurii]MBE4864056.1 hypothetical protein [Enterobacter cloacae complex sp. P40C2]MBE4876230.1 hypothetical protein [Enterobacter cloacae complex sp. P40C]MCY0773319.1 hypothetical protein [Enterobacter cloacae complex sp. 2022EL-00788]
MNWLRAKRLNVAIVIAVLATLVVLAFKYFTTTSTLQYGNVEDDFQMGFYDLMSQQKEIYDVSLKTTRGVLMANITSPDDNRFVLKGKFTPTQKKHGRIYFTLTPIYYSTEQKGLMIDGLVDQLMYSNYWMEPLSFNHKSLVVGQNGAIFLYPASR